MKKVLLLPLICAAHCVLGQDNPARNIVKAHLLSPLLRAVSAGIERKFTERVGGQLSFYLINNRGFKGFGITPEARFHPIGGGLTGFYVGPYGRYNSGTVRLLVVNNLADRFMDINVITVGAVVGYEFMPVSRLTVDLTARAGFFLGELQSDGSRPKIDMNAIDGRELFPGVAVGWAF